MFLKLGTKYLLSTGSIAKRQQCAAEHFACREIPVRRFCVVGCVFSSDSFSQQIDGCCFISTRERDLSFEREFGNLRYVRSRIREHPYFGRQSLTNSTQRSEFCFSIRRLLRSSVRTAPREVPERGRDRQRRIWFRLFQNVIPLAKPGQ